MQRPRRRVAAPTRPAGGPAGVLGAVGGRERPHPPRELIQRADRVTQRPRPARQLVGAGERSDVQQRGEPARRVALRRCVPVALVAGDRAAQPGVVVGVQRPGGRRAASAAANGPHRATTHASRSPGERPGALQAPFGDLGRPPRPPARRSPRAPAGAQPPWPPPGRSAPPDPTQARQRPQTSPQVPPQPARRPPLPSPLPTVSTSPFVSSRPSSAASTLRTAGALARVTPVLLQALRTSESLLETTVFSGVAGAPEGGAEFDLEPPTTARRRAAPARRAWAQPRRWRSEALSGRP